MNLLEMFMGSMTQDASVDSIAKKTGADSSQIKKLIIMAIPIIIAYLTKNASKKEGADSLKGALKDHTSTKGFASQLAEADEADGAKILGHILGGDQDNVAKDLAKESGMDPAQVLKTLGVMAPVIMSGLSAATGSASKASQKSGFDLSDGFDMSDVMGLMGGATQGNAGGIEGLIGGLLGGGKQANPLDMLGGLMGGTQKKSQADGSDLLKALLGM